LFPKFFRTFKRDPIGKFWYHRRLNLATWRLKDYALKVEEATIRAKLLSALNIANFIPMTSKRLNAGELNMLLLKKKSMSMQASAGAS